MGSIDMFCHDQTEIQNIVYERKAMKIRNKIIVLHFQYNKKRFFYENHISNYKVVLSYKAKNCLKTKTIERRGGKSRNK